MPEKILQKVEIALFPANQISSESFNLLFGKIITNLPEFENGGNTILPPLSSISTSMSPPTSTTLSIPDLPRILLNTADNKHSIQIGSNKIDIFWFNPNEEQKFAIEFSDIETTLIKLNEALGAHFLFKRVGFIIEYFFSTDPNKVAGVSIFTQKLGENLKGFSLQNTYHKELLINGENVLCNEVISLNPGKTNDGKQDVMLVQSDWNSRPEVKLDYSMEQVIKFLSETTQKNTINASYRRLF